MNRRLPYHQQSNRQSSGLPSAVFGLRSSPCGLRSAVCRLRSAVCGLRPAVSSSRGFSLVELLVATIIIIIVFLSWLRISNFQAIRKESLRRAAIEKAAGYLDFMTGSGADQGAYTIAWVGNSYSNVVSDPSDPSDASYRVPPLFENNDPIGYVLVVTNWPAVANWPGDHGWPEAGRWAVIQLYDEHGVSTNDAGRPFSTMSVFMQ